MGDIGMGMGGRKGAGSGSGHNSLTPHAGEPPVVVLKMQVLGCEGFR